jgi:hypothetical protein
MSVADVGLRCYRCLNEEAAAKMGVDFDKTPLQPVAVSDADPRMRAPLKADGKTSRRRSH